MARSWAIDITSWYPWDTQKLNVVLCESLMGCESIVQFEVFRKDNQG